MRNFLRWAGFWAGEIAGVVSLFGLMWLGMVIAGILGGN